MEQVTIETNTNQPFERFRYEGDAFAYAMVYFKTLLLIIVTLGIYYPWARTERRRYIWSHVSFLSDKSAYTGNGQELFLGWVKLLAILLVVGGVSNAIFGSIFGIGWALTAIVNFALYVFVGATGVYSGLRYKLSRSTWRGVRFGVYKNRQTSREFLILYAKGLALTFVTLGFYFPYFKHNQIAFLMEKTHFGDRRFSYTGTASELASIYYRGIFLSVLTLGIYIPWLIRNLAEYRFTHLQFEGGYFQFDLKPTDILIYGIGSYLLGVVTLGLATPFLIHWWLKLFTESLSFGGRSLEFLSGIQQVSQAGNAFGDAAADDYDVDFGFF